MKAILDCDPGNGWPGADIDDGLALGLMLKSPEIELLAITIVAGNTPVQAGYASARHMMGLTGREVPILCGGGRPLVEDPAPWRAALDGRGRRDSAIGFWRNVPEPDVAVPDCAAEGAAQSLVRIVNAHPGEVTVFAIGPLTNLACAIALDPRFTANVKRFVVMGGGFNVRHKPQELNFCYDPEAARIVLGVGVDTLVVPLDTTLKTELTLEGNDRLRTAPDPLIRYLGETTDPWIRFVMDTRKRRGCALHDPLAIAAALDESLVTVMTSPVDVELAGTLTRGRPVSWVSDDPSPNPGVDLSRGSDVRVAWDVNAGRFTEFMLDRMTAG